MGKEYTAKSFKSGNSVAIRIPAALGVKPDWEFSIIDDDGTLVLRPTAKTKRKFNIDKVWGSAIGSGLEFIKDEDRVFEHRPLLWDDPAWRAEQMPDA